MKQGFLITVLIVAILFGINLLVMLGFPVWILAIIFPTVIYGQIYALNRYTFRQSLDFEPIPALDFPDRLTQLEANHRKFSEFGFVKFDEFLLRTSSNVVAYIYQHQTEPIYLCNYHFGQFEFSDLVTSFDDEFTLTTADTKKAGNVPRPNEKMLQIFDGQSIDELLFHHHQAIQFLQTQGFSPKQLFPESFRTDFLKSYFEVGKKVTSLASPAKLIYWMASGVNKKYCKTVQQQYLAKQLLLPE